ncbi:restriction endonuclease subunit S (plasmid) [Acinetobacter baumannii]|nr:restriction endonuclease subunit S [Acinetobacter baumannii]MDA3497643.1 restriction endonuclease subunit S [Acinetobacter baumannii]QTM21974.1 restriction endonuclease subunit S [Acinetobacter baumannii]HCA5311341.1 restriction endonuclease subunit S [Acinetobacter baumannii]
MAAPKLRFKEFDGDWTGLKIIDLVKSLDAGVSVNSEDVEPKEDEYSVLKTSCISSGYFDENERKRVLQDGEIQRLKEPVLDDSILMSRMNTPLLVGMNAYVFKAPKNTFLPDRLWQLKIDDNKTVTRWLAFYLGSDQGLNQIRDLASGTSNSMKNITKPDVLNIDLFAPQKEEQTKIASFLSAVDEKISQLTQKHALLTQYKQGMMQKLFSQEIRFKADDGSEFGEWENKPLSELSEKAMYGMNASATEYDGLNKYLRITDICEISHKLKRDNLTSPNAELEEKYKLGYGDLLFARTGASVGKSYLYSVDDGIAYFAGFLIKFSLKLDLVNPYFLFAQTLTLDFDKWVITNSMRSGQPGINAEEYSSYIFKVPCLEEQTKIANFLSAIDQKIEGVAQQIEQAKQWKKGLLQQMFI